MCYHKYVRSPWICPFLSKVQPVVPHSIPISWGAAESLSPRLTRPGHGIHEHAIHEGSEAHERPILHGRMQLTRAIGKHGMQLEQHVFFPSNWNKWIFLADNKSGTHMYKYKHKGLGGCFLLAEKDQCMCGIMLSFPFWGWKIVMIQSNASKSYSVKKNHHLFCVQKMEPVGFDSIILYIYNIPSGNLT